MTEVNTSKKNLPSHTIYWVSEGSDKSSWTRVGAGWEHKDGEGINLDLNLIPRDGKLVIRRYKPKAK